MGKKINNHFELKDVCRSAALWYVGSFMLEHIMRQDEWSNPETKEQFIKHMYNEYEGIDDDISGTRTRVNCMIRIIESGLVEDAMQLVLDANIQKLGIPEAKENAQAVLDGLKSGKYTYKSIYRNR